MEEFIICDICTIVYDGELRCPRILTCGHSFCSSCVKNLLAKSSCCLTCKSPIEKESLEFIPINCVLKKIVEKFSLQSASDPSGSKIKDESGSNIQHQVDSLPSKGFCKIHNVPKHFGCLTCNVWICGDCVAISHKLCKTLLVNEAIDKMNEESYIKIRKCFEMITEGEVESLNLAGHYKNMLTTKNKEVKSYQQKLILLKEEICEMNRKLEKVLDLQTVLTSIKGKLECQMSALNVASSTNDSDAIGEKLTEHFISLKEAVEYLKFYKSCMLKNTRSENEDFLNNKKILMAAVTSGKEVIIIANDNNTKSFGKLVVEEEVFKIHSMQHEPHPPFSIFLTLDSCLATTIGWKKLPQKIFIQLSSDDVPLGDIIICLNESVPEASKTILGECHLNSKQMLFLEMEMRSKNDGGNLLYSYCSIPVPSTANGEALLKEMKTKKWKEGEFRLNVWNGNDGKELNFGFCVTNNDVEISYIPTGQVEKGMEVIKDSFQRCERQERVEVVNSGWVLN